MANQIERLNGIQTRSIQAVNGQLAIWTTSTDDDIQTFGGKEFLAAPLGSATGGTVTTSGDYKFHTFTSSNTFTVNTATIYDVLVIAGGGSGGRSFCGAGGGAGGYVEQNDKILSTGSYSITIGAGGPGVGYEYANGTNSVFDVSGTPMTAIGGGYGSIGGGAGNPGGSSGGSTSANTTAGTQGDSGGGTGYGNAGGYLTGGWFTNGPGAGGGGAGGAGGNSYQSGSCSGFGGSGGIGRTWLDGTDRAGGGGGSGANINTITCPGRTYSSGSGRAGGGNGNSTGSGGNATANSGSGGGGSGGSPTVAGGSGGSGVVIIRYKYQ